MAQSNDAPTPETFNLVLIGDGYVGKTTIFDVIQNKVTQTNQATVYNEFSFEKENSDGIMVKFKLLDTAGQEEFDQLRKRFYGEASLFIICFCVTDETSLENARLKWFKDIEEYRSKPIILIGTKSDLREVTPQLAITVNKIQRTAKKINALQYIECSAVKDKDCEKIIDCAVDILCNKNRNNKKTCVLQ